MSIELSSHVEGEATPLCPLCDNPIFCYESFEVATAHETVFLVHQFCAKETQEQEDTD